MSNRPKPAVLIILDGWGVAPRILGNAVASAKTPNFDKYLKDYIPLTLQASGEAVGLPFGEPGNSEVGHTNLGAGKIIYQSLPRITQAVWNGSFFKNPSFIGAIEHAKNNNSNLHIMGLMSNGGIHSYLEHFFSLMELIKLQDFKNVFIHAFLDGRDTEKNAGFNFVSQIIKMQKTWGFSQLATISGRFYAMDRDSHWDRISKTYNAMVLGESQEKFSDPLAAIKSSYDKKIYDEEFVPVVITGETGEPIVTINDNDSLIFFNFRPDRAREISETFVSKDIKGFSPAKRVNNIFFVSMTEYKKDLATHVAFPPEAIDRPLPRIISDAGLTQFHIAETEKYAHVTFFFAGGREDPFPGQENCLVPSPRISSYADKPDMSAGVVTEKLAAAIESNEYDFIIVNYANLDMVGHTGNFQAGVKAVEFIDQCLGQIIPEILKKDGFALITADHGNAEEMINLQTGEIDKEHSTNPVPCIFISNRLVKPKSEPVNLVKLIPSGVLADVAPTFLKIMNIEKPPEMMGRSLL